MKHSPLPWKCGPDGYGRWKFEGGYNGTIASRGGAEVYRGPSSFKSLCGKTEEEAIGNAELIVRAVNSHYELIEALEKWARWDYEVQSAKASGESIYTSADFQRMREEASTATDAALAKAKEAKPEEEPK